MTALHALASFTAAVLVVIAGGFVPRPTGAVAVYNHECRTPGGGRCVEPQEATGWPFAWVFDTPGVSVEHRVFLFEDTVRPGPFALNVAVVWAAFAGLTLAWTRRHPAAEPDGWAVARAGCVVFAVQAAALALWQTPLSAGPLRWLLFPLMLPALGLGAVADGAARGGLSTAPVLGVLVVGGAVLSAGGGAAWALWRGRADRG